jgi:hypothetical protein
MGRPPSAPGCRERRRCAFSAIRLPSLTQMRHPSPEAVGPGSRLRRRYADPPTAAFVTGLGVGGRSPLRSRPYAHVSLVASGHTFQAARHLAPPPSAGIKARPFGRCAALTPLVVGARWSVPAPGKSAPRASPGKRRWESLPTPCHAIFSGMVVRLPSGGDCRAHRTPRLARGCQKVGT